MHRNRPALGIDIGGSFIKIAPVDVDSGKLMAVTQTVPVPKPATPDSILEIIQTTIRETNWTGPVGVGYPGVIRNGVTLTACHVSDEWLGYRLLDRLGEFVSAPVALLNDADAAGLAEMTLGAGRDRNRPGGGTVVTLTLGTGIGSALFRDGKLFPNTEFGHIELDGEDAERMAAASVRTTLGLTWQDYGRRLNHYLDTVLKLLSPDRVILGGGISENYNQFSNFLTGNVEIMPASLGNSAGLIGAAVATSVDESEQK